MAFEDKELGDERLSQVAGGRSIGGYIEYTVTRGDTLAKIAQKYHVTERDLTDLNGIRNSTLLYLGQILKVPVNIRC
ncbi:MAG TPA: LysM domain-containing protein [Candidatus Limiplasma sp.]|nr:LysM domain-containing protein [Candidatus Limiplasma sp.]HPS80999.1 LysM domain-containing protein [Candidatus Limiplasma sp.]